tara:strand:- start:1073 stop:1426 length:354 start_codon:yes stop_codon:yes gene_type:complete
MNFEQYMTKAMKTVFEGYQPSDEAVVETSIQHLPITEEHPSQWDHDFYMASMNLVGKIRKFDESDTSYNVINVYGHRFDRLTEFMKDNGFEFHGIRQFCRANEAPEIRLSWTLDENN